MEMNQLRQCSFLLVNKKKTQYNLCHYFLQFSRKKGKCSATLKSRIRSLFFLRLLILLNTLLHILCISHSMPFVMIGLFDTNSSVGSTLQTRDADVTRLCQKSF